MHYYNSISFCRQLVKKIVFAIAAILFSSLSIKAQSYSRSQSYNDESRYGIGIGSDYDAPVGNLAYTFKPAINYNLNLTERNNAFTYGISLGYHVYKPKLDTFYYQESNTDYGTVHYQNFSVYSFYLAAAYSLPLSDQLKIYAGINFGAYFTHYAFHSSDYLLDDTENINETNVYLALRLGLTYSLSDHIDIGVEGKYNLFAPTGKKSDDDLVGSIYSTYAAGLQITYIF